MKPEATSSTMATAAVNDMYDVCFEYDCFGVRYVNEVHHGAHIYPRSVSPLKGIIYIVLFL